MTLLPEARTVLDAALLAYAGRPEEADLRGLRDRLDEPLRVAIAGRVKAGKSTLLNALVGERLAPTDAGECTRVVTWFQDGHTYRVEVQPVGGAPRQARFERDDGALEIDLGGLPPEKIERIVVTWPSHELRTATLIDTPGIGSLSEHVSKRTWELLAVDDDETPADAVLYLMKHLHVDDLEFLRAFHDTEVSRPNPVNAIGVLSRADEIGVGRLDSMASARRICTRLGRDPRVRRVVQTVVPLAGLLAETAETLTQAEFAQLSLIAALAPREVEDLLLSADRFLVERPELRLTTIEREALLGRFGIFGIRLAATLVRQKVTPTAPALSRELRARSGLQGLHDVLQTLFYERRDVLKSRSALLAVDTLLRRRPPAGAEGTRLAGEVERILASAHPFHELRVLSSLRAGWITGKPDVLADLERLIGGEGTATTVRLGLTPDADPEVVRHAALQTLGRWQRRAESPMTGHQLAVASRVAVRTCEGILAELAAPA
ncbi:MAG TPA: dynamin family protein [Kineosporiaceae bacterium]|nr:dynamin family protein [Kineosporiaceae bacterium]